MIKKKENKSCIFCKYCWQNEKSMRLKCFNPGDATAVSLKGFDINRLAELCKYYEREEGEK